MTPVELAHGTPIEESSESRSQTPRLSRIVDPPQNDEPDTLPPSSPPTPISPADSVVSQHENTYAYNGHNGMLVSHTIKVEEGYCAGQWIEWEAGSVWITYPYQRHNDDGLPWTPIGFRGNSILLRSVDCSAILNSDREQERCTCNACFGLRNSLALNKLMDRASVDGAAAHTPWKYLNASQLQRLVELSREKNERMKLKVCLPDSFNS